MTRVIFMGTPAFAVPSLETLAGSSAYEIVWVITQPDRPAGRGRRMAAPAVKEAALQRELPLWQPETMRDEPAVSRLRQAAPDVIVVAAFGEILRPNVLEIPPRGIVNVHASLLPRHRGASPVAGALLAGDEVTGVTLMLMDAGMDTGPILDQAPLPIAPDDDRGSLMEKLALLGARRLEIVLPRWLHGEISPQAQDDSLATKTSLIRKAHGRVDWEGSARQIWRRCRAFTPWPGLYTTWRNQRLKILRCHPLEDAPHAAPGTTLVRSDMPAVATGQGILILDVVQLAGKRPGAGRDFLRGHRDYAGCRLE